MEEDKKPEFKLLDFTKRGEPDPSPGTLAPEKYNITVGGRLLKMKVEPCTCGLRAVYFYEMRLVDLLPPDAPEFLKEATKDQKKFIETIDEHFTLTWVDKILGRGYAYHIKKFHERTKSMIADIDGGNDEAKRVVKEL